MNVADILQAHRIDLGDHKTTCPKCSSERQKAHQKVKCLSIKIDDKGVCWNCHHCGWVGPEKGNGSDSQFRATHDYHDADGRYLYTKVRYHKGHDPKCRLARRNGAGSDSGTGQQPRALYRLPEVLAAIKAGRTIVVVEGESDADALWAIGVPATCSRDGAAKPGQKPKWLLQDSDQLRGAKGIVVLGDHDPAGYAHQEATARLTAGVVPSVRILKLAEHWPECPDGGDVSDWLKAGHTHDELTAMINAAPEYEFEVNLAIPAIKMKRNNNLKPRKAASPLKQGFCSRSRKVSTSSTRQMKSATPTSLSITIARRGRSAAERSVVGSYEVIMSTRRSTRFRGGPIGSKHHRGTGQA